MKRSTQGKGRVDTPKCGKPSDDNGDDAQFEAFLQHARILDGPEADAAFAEAFRRILPVRLEQRRRKPRARTHPMRLDPPEH